MHAWRSPGTDPELMPPGRSRNVVRPYLANRAWYTRRSCAVVCGGGPRAYTNRPRAYTKQNTKNHIWLQTLAPDVGGVAERAVLPCAPHAKFRDPSF